MLRDITIRNVDKLNDLNEIIYKFDKEFHPSLRSRVLDLNQYSKKLFNYAKNIVAICNGEIIGFASLYCNDEQNSTAYLSQIAVLKNARRNGVGQLLLDEVIKIAVINNMKYLKLEVLFNNPAYNFYKKNGFYDLDKASSKSIYMIKDLVNTYE